MYLIFACAFIISNHIVAQEDSSAYESIMAWANYHSDVDTVTTFLIDERGDSIKVDTLKRHYHYGKKYNKQYSVFRNDTLSEEMIYYKDKLSHVNFYVRGKNTKRMVYSLRRPYHLMKIVYFNEKEERSKIEYYDKKGNMIKEVYENED